ncbi:MAG: hypothetical protein WC307_04305 [Candidatus Nanoarchaeia archaeon]|jgi:hypothetical protein
MSKSFLNKLIKKIKPELINYFVPNGKTIINKEVCSMKDYFLRINSFNNIDYLLCPVPHLFNEGKQIESGFAIDANDDYFTVYAYMYKYDEDKLLILPKLPHCVHKAVMLDGSDYSTIDSKIIKFSSRDSALLFINNYLNDLAVGNDSPVEFFDNKLYQQLINRLVTINDKSWCSDDIINLRLDQLLKNFEVLEEASPLFSNNQKRAYHYLNDFLFGCEDNINNSGFIEQVNFNRINQFSQEFYSETIRRCQVGRIEYLKKISGVKPVINNIDVQIGYVNAIQKESINNCINLFNITGINIDVNLLSKINKFDDNFLSHAKEVKKFLDNLKKLIDLGLIKIK